MAGHSPSNHAPGVLSAVFEAKAKLAATTCIETSPTVLVAQLVC